MSLENIVRSVWKRLLRMPKIMMQQQKDGSYPDLCYHSLCRHTEHKSSPSQPRTWCPLIQKRKHKQSFAQVLNEKLLSCPR